VHGIHVAEHEQRRLTPLRAADARHQMAAHSGGVVRLDSGAPPLQLACQTMRDRGQCPRIERGGFERNERFEERDARTLELARAGGELQGVDQGTAP
jgi:hypothetical protein